jgi:DNA-directed RNA polymerase subunit RPC12/RpoP
MIEYTLVCPHCGEKARVIERATVIRDTVLIGFREYEDYSDLVPEFSLDEEFSDDQSDYCYVCSGCEKELATSYDQLFNYVKKHGEISGVTNKDGDKNAED